MKKHLAPRRSGRSALGHRLTVEPLESRLLLAAAPWSIDDHIAVQGAHLNVQGTTGVDSFEVTTGGEYRITLNGATRAFSTSAINRITLIADAEDTVVLHDTAGDDTIYENPFEATIVADGLTVEATGAGTITVIADGGGVDEAHLRDSKGDELFTSHVDWSTMTGDGFVLRVELVEYVHGYADSGGNDRATIYGSEADESFVGKRDFARLTGDGYALRAKFFSDITAYGGGGADEAKLVDSNGNDTFYATPTQAAMFGDGYIRRAIEFDYVHGYARNGGRDIANLHDSAGNDRYVANDVFGKLTGDGFLIRAKFFESVYAYADSGGNDEAQLSGSEGDDTLESRSTHTWLRGEGYEHWIGAFDYVFARARSGADEALIYDTDGIDTVVVEDRAVSISEGATGTERLIQGFGVVTTRVSQPADQVTVVDEPGLDIRIDQPGGTTILYASAYLDSNDPTWGIQNAIDALPNKGGIVVLPEGTFTLRQGLVLRDGVTLRGAGENTILVRPDHLEVRLTRSATTGDTVLDVESTAGFRVGDDIAVIAYGQAEVAHRTIVKIESGKIYLDAAIAVEGSYSPDSSASVVNYIPLIRTAWYQEKIDTHDIVVEDLVLDGNMDESVEAWRLSAPALLHLERAVDAVVRNLKVRNANAGGIYAIGGHDNRIEDSSVEKVRGHGIFVEFELDTIISGVAVRSAGYASRGTAGDGIFVVGSDNVRVEDSLVDGTMRHGLHPGGDLNRGGVWISNVSRNNGENAFHFCWDNFDLLVTGNVLENSDRYGVGGLGLGGPFGDMFNTVADNLIRGNARQGILVNGGSDNTITGNTIVDNSQMKSGKFSGVLLADSRYVVVANNTIGTAVNQPSQKYGVEESGIADANQIIGNELAGNIEAGIYLIGSTTTVDGNTGSIQSDD